MKKCTVCGIEKHEDDFYKNVRKCKACYCEKIRLDRIKNPEVFKARDAKRAMSPNRIAAREAYLKTEKGRAAKKRATTNWINKSTIKRSAHILVGNYIRDGKLEKRPCEVCGSAYRVHAHHDDYAYPLDVRWLCAAHHRQWHIANGEAKNAG